MKRTILKQLLDWIEKSVPQQIKGFVLLLLIITIMSLSWALKKEKEGAKSSDERIASLQEIVIYSRKRADTAQAMLMRCYEGKSNQGRDLLDLMERFERMKQRSDSILNETKKLKQKWK